MSDLISRQAAIMHFVKAAKKYECGMFDLEEATHELWKVPSAEPERTCEYWDSESKFCTLCRPSAQPERKKGRWILHESQRKEDVACGNYLYICSKCGKSDIHAKTQEVPFCWWCGADMRGGEDEAD